MWSVGASKIEDGEEQCGGVGNSFDGGGHFNA
jgi:hypothetical protein